MKRNAWWREARFGVFIHFGAYAVPARGEWVQSNERLSVEAKTARTWWGDEGKGHFFVNVAEPTYQTFRLPDPTDTVFAVELE
jgi:hypothetical protein